MDFYGPGSQANVPRLGLLLLLGLHFLRVFTLRTRFLFSLLFGICAISAPIFSVLSFFVLGSFPFLYGIFSSGSFKASPYLSTFQFLFPLRSHDLLSFLYSPALGPSALRARTLLFPFRGKGVMGIDDNLCTLFLISRAASGRFPFAHTFLALARDLLHNSYHCRLPHSIIAELEFLKYYDYTTQSTTLA